MLVKLYASLLRRIAIVIILTVNTTFASDDYIVKDEFINIKYLHTKIDEIGSELYAKSGISLYLLAVKSTNGTPLVKYEIEVSKNLKIPFVLLSMTLDEKKIDILVSHEVDKTFDRDQVLSPYPWSGTVVPILTSKIKGDPTDKYASALLNGYADIADQIADYYDIELKSSIGNANKNTINFFRVIFYSIIFFALSYYIYRRFIKNV